MKTIYFNRSVFAGLFLASTMAFTACKKDKKKDEVTLPAAVVTTYDGEVQYTSSTGNTILETDATATIAASGDTYTISFSDGVPSLSGLRFKNEDGGYATIADDGSLAGISIDGNDLAVGVVNNGNNWSFSGTR